MDKNPDRLFCFIICANDSLLESECQNYIQRLWVPEGYDTEILTIHDADSLASAYNAAMKESRAKYKIYLHQDLFIVNRFFLQNILDIFSADESIGLIGLVGTTTLPDSAIMWKGARIGKHGPGDNEPDDLNARSQKADYIEAVAADGAILVTSKDVPWREDIFDGFDFYDVSECFEHRRAGYKVVIPVQDSVWCIHDDGFWMNLFNYDKYRRRFLQEYSPSEFRLPYETDSGVCDSRNASDERYCRILEKVGKEKDQFISSMNLAFERVDRALKESSIDDFINSELELAKMIDNDEIQLSGDVQKNIYIARGVMKETQLEVPAFIDGINSLDELLQKYTLLELYLRRIELSCGDGFEAESYAFIEENAISAYMVSAILYNDHSKFFRKTRILELIAAHFLSAGKRDMAVHYLAQIKIHEND